MRRLTVAAVVGALALSACTAEEPEVLGVQLESPSPEAPETTPAEPTEAPAPTEAATPSETESAPAPTETATETPGTEAPVETPTTEAPAPPAPAPTTQPPAPRPQPTRAPEPAPEVLGAREAEGRTEWSTTDEGGTRRWIETSSRQITREDVAVLGVGLADTGAAADAPTRQARCAFELTAPEARRAVMQGQLVMDLVVDGALRKRAIIRTDIILEKGTTYVLPAESQPAAVELSLADTETVRCTGTFTPSS